MLNWEGSGSILYAMDILKGLLDGLNLTVVNSWIGKKSQ